MREITLLEQVTWNPDLFKDIVLPEKIIPHMETVINQIMADNANLKCAYPHPQMFKQMVDHFFKSRLTEFTRMYETVIADYDPIENYNRYEDSNDTSGGGFTDTNGGSNTTVNEVSAMNSGGFQNDDKSTTTLGTTYTRKNDGRYTHHSRIHGNIGVTTTQQMLESERKLLEFNYFKYVSSKFAEDLMIRVYD